jgi:hypothetical protein
MYSVWLFSCLVIVDGVNELTYAKSDIAVNDCCNKVEGYNTGKETIVVVVVVVVVVVAVWVVNWALVGWFGCIV